MAEFKYQKISDDEIATMEAQELANIEAQLRDMEMTHFRKARDGDTEALSELENRITATRKIERELKSRLK